MGIPKIQKVRLYYIGEDVKCIEYTYSNGQISKRYTLSQRIKDKVAKKVYDYNAQRIR